MSPNDLTDTELEQRAAYSEGQLAELRRRLGELRELENFPTLTIFAAGSYARLEAGEFSDIDMFFLSGGEKSDVSDPRTKSHRLFGKVIEIVDQMGFPKFSNDCEYLVILHSADILRNLGSRTDDHENYFTARMLLLLEGHCLYGDEVHDRIVNETINSYFVDYPDHRETFLPTFLVNDICRYWKTLLLNYENKRKTFPSGESDDRIKQRVRNFKLKFSRMTTCYASVAALGSYGAPVAAGDVMELTRLTPRQRLEAIKERMPSVADDVDQVLEQYRWFLKMTGLATTDLEARFADHEKRTAMFARATEYGDAMFKLLSAIDRGKPGSRLLRTLGI